MRKKAESDEIEERGKGDRGGRGGSRDTVESRVGETNQDETFAATHRYGTNTPPGCWN